MNLQKKYPPARIAPLPRKIQGNLGSTSSQQPGAGWYIYAKFSFVFDFESCQPLQKHNKSNLSSMKADLMISADNLRQ